MFAYRFNSNHRWVLFAEENTWAESNPVDIVAVLDSVKSQFEQIFGFDYVNKFSVCIFKSSDKPQIFYEPNAIFLNCSFNNWAQFIYQFAHELCHLMINDNFHSKLKWFEIREFMCTCGKNP
ncbi:MAG: hypothetical protein LBR56_04545 [Sporomusaceae bacterium]|jgi:hypothetical protein|nr:hypothetical protein [Sporomusaceae bacterium]